MGALSRVLRAGQQHKKESNDGVEMGRSSYWSVEVLAVESSLAFVDNLHTTFVPPCFCSLVLCVLARCFATHLQLLFCAARVRPVGMANGDTSSPRTFSLLSTVPSRTFYRGST